MLHTARAIARVRARLEKDPALEQANVCPACKVLPVGISDLLRAVIQKPSSVCWNRKGLSFFPSVYPSIEETPVRGMRHLQSGRTSP